MIRCNREGRKSATADETASVAFLLGVKGRVLTDDPEVADMCDIDMALTGWPWGEGNFSWVEPTSWACLALRRVGQREHPRVTDGDAGGSGDAVRGCRL